MNTETMQAAPFMTSSPVTAAARFPCPTRSAWSLIPFKSALRSPVSCVPPSGVGIGGPRHRPLRCAMGADLARAAGEDVGMDQGRAVDGRGQIVLEAIGEME